MKNIPFLSASLLLLSMPAMAQKAQELPSSHIETRLFPEFHAIEAFNGVEVSLGSISQADRAGAYVTASSSGLLRKIKTEVVGQVLRVYLDPDGDSTWRGVKRPENYKLRIVLNDLRTLRITKGALVTFEDNLSVANNKALSIDMFSGGRLLGPVHLNTLIMTLRGGSKAVIRGTASSVNVRVVEGSSFLSPELESQECTAYAASASQIRLSVAQTLSAQSINEAEISYSGRPAVKTAYCKEGGKISKRLRI